MLSHEDVARGQRRSEDDVARAHAWVARGPRRKETEEGARAGMTTATSTPMATSHESRCSLRERGEGLACRARDSWSPSIVRRWDDIRVAFPREVHTLK